jgi:hypothetical protein
VFNWKTIFLVILLFIFTLYFNYIKQDVKIEEIKSMNMKDDISVIPMYQDVFKKEEHQNSRLETIEYARDLRKINEESQRIIANADKLIELNHLTLPIEQMSEDEELNVKKTNEKLEKLNIKLEEFSHEM